MPSRLRSRRTHSRARLDILVQVEEIGRVVGVLQRHERVVVRSIADRIRSSPSAPRLLTYTPCSETAAVRSMRRGSSQCSCPIRRERPSSEDRCMRCSATHRRTPRCLGTPRYSGLSARKTPVHTFGATVKLQVVLAYHVLNREAAQVCSAGPGHLLITGDGPGMRPAGRWAALRTAPGPPVRSRVCAHPA